jgi:hypothetical protein
MRGYDKPETDQLFDRLRAFDLALHGNCSGVCWMKQVRRSTSLQLLQLCGAADVTAADSMPSTLVDCMTLLLRARSRPLEILTRLLKHRASPAAAAAAAVTARVSCSHACTVQHSILVTPCQGSQARQRVEIHGRRPEIPEIVEGSSMG